MAVLFFFLGSLPGLMLCDSAEVRKPHLSSYCHNNLRRLYFSGKVLQWVEKGTKPTALVDSWDFHDDRIALLGPAATTLWMVKGLCRPFSIHINTVYNGSRARGATRRALHLTWLTATTQLLEENRRVYNQVSNFRWLYVGTMMLTMTTL